jgi:hypothetical protein
MHAPWRTPPDRAAAGGRRNRFAGREGVPGSLVPGALVPRRRRYPHGGGGATESRRAVTLRPATEDVREGRAQKTPTLPGGSWRKGNATCAA